MQHPYSRVATLKIPTSKFTLQRHKELLTQYPNSESETLNKGYLNTKNNLMKHLMYRSGKASIWPYTTKITSCNSGSHLMQHDGRNAFFSSADATSKSIYRLGMTIRALASASTIGTCLHPTTKIDTILLGIELVSTQLIPYCKGRASPRQNLVPNHQVNLIIAQIMVFELIAT